MDKSQSRRIAFFLPNLFTALNIGCGYFAVIFAITNRFEFACYLLLLGALFDLVDGRVARMTGTQSSFGEQFDSMSDLVSFGLAPSLIFYQNFLQPFGRSGMVLACFYALCGALRLARFNANIDNVSSDFFQGLPIPMAAMSLVGYSLFAAFFSSYHLSYFEYFASIYILVFALLMISNIPFFSFKKADFIKKYKKQTFFILVILLLLLVIEIKVALFAIINLYVGGSLVFYLFNRKKFKGIFDWKPAPEEEEA